MTKENKKIELDQVSDKIENKIEEVINQLEIEEIEYSTHRDQLENARPSLQRVKEIADDFVSAFNKVIVQREVPFIIFEDVSAIELAEAFERYPRIIKSILSSVNVAQRAIKRDLGIDIDTYSEKISVEKSLMLASYIKPLLPKELAIPALLELDRYFWTDKTMRATKGAWEKKISEKISLYTNMDFKKTQFKSGNERFELDAAYPVSKDSLIEYGIDIKRIESMRDIHKRTDEIVNKANKFKSEYPNGKFFTVVYLPFPNQHININNRMAGSLIDGIYFAGESDASIENTTKLLVSHMGFELQDV